MDKENNKMIHINLPSETATLKTVVMCYATYPATLGALIRYGGLDTAFLYQSWYNRFGVFSDLEKARRQQQAFMDVMQAHGVEILLAPPVLDCFSQQYTRDIGFAIDDTYFCANPRRYFRQRELEGLRELLPRFSKVVHLEDGTIEGGDVMIDERFVIVGLGEETSREGVECLKTKLKEMGSSRELVTIEFSHRGTIHLDTKFNIPVKGIGLIHPPSFKPESLRWFEKHFDLIEVTEKERLRLEINTFTIAPQKVIMLSNGERLASLLAAKGVEPILVDYSEVTKQGGSFRCTTLPIERV